MAMVKNLLAGIGCLTLIVVLAVAGWWFRDDIRAWMNGRNTIVMEAPSPELALRAERKIEELIQGGGENETRFSEAELQSYVQYRLVERLPAGVTDPAVDLRDSTIAIRAGLDLTRLEAGGTAVENLRRMIGDSTVVTGELLPRVAGPGQGRVEVLSLQAGIFPVPPLLIGTALQGIGLPTEGRTVLLDVPEDVVSVRVENEELILVRRR